MACREASVVLIIVSISPSRHLPRSNNYTALKNADSLLRDVVRAMDKNGDEVIQYEGKPPVVSQFV